MPAWLVSVWNFVWTRIWKILFAVLAVVFAVFVVRPFKSIPDPGPEDVAAAWNTSIGRLGIQPLYPPTEDFGVGDVLAVVADSENVPLLGKAVRIAHIDLRDLILASTVEPVFADTADLAAGSSFRKQDRTEVAIDSKDRRITLALSAFPGITISHVTQSAAAAGNATGFFGSARNGNQVEEIQIKGAETYGVSTIEAIVKFNNWCRDDKTKAYCDDSFVRQALAFAVSDRVLATRKVGTAKAAGTYSEGAKDTPSSNATGTTAPAPTTAPKEYAARLQLQLVTRVYLTREIEQRRMNEAAAGAAVQALADPSAKPDPAAAKPGDQSGIEAINRNLAASGTTGAKVAIVRSDGVSISLQETFQRPIAFGFRAVTISLTPSMPGNDQKAQVP
jgi:hypothetical protein